MSEFMAYVSCESCFILPPCPSSSFSLCELVKPTEKLFNITRLRQRSDEALFGLILVRALDMEFNLVQLSQTWGKGSAVGVAAWIGLISMYVCT